MNEHAANERHAAEMADTPKALDELIEPGSTLMVGTTVPDGRLEFRPLTAARVRDGRIEILLDTNEQWVTGFHDGDRIDATMGDNRTNTWLSFSGTATITTDDRLIDELWNPFAAAYFDNGRESAGIAVFTIDVDRGRYWSTTSGRLGSLISMVRAKLGSPHDAGQHGEIAV